MQCVITYCSGCQLFISNGAASSATTCRPPHPPSQQSPKTVSRRQRHFCVCLTRQGPTSCVASGVSSSCFPVVAASSCGFAICPELRDQLQSVPVGSEALISLLQSSTLCFVCTDILLDTISSSPLSELIAAPQKSCCTQNHDGKTTLESLASIQPLQSVSASRQGILCRQFRRRTERHYAATCQLQPGDVLQLSCTKLALGGRVSTAKPVDKVFLCK